MFKVAYISKPEKKKNIDKKLVENLLKSIFARALLLKSEKMSSPFPTLTNITINTINTKAKDNPHWIHSDHAKNLLNFLNPKNIKQLVPIKTIVDIKSIARLVQEPQSAPKRLLSVPKLYLKAATIWETPAIIKLKYNKVPIIQAIKKELCVRAKT